MKQKISITIEDSLSKKIDSLIDGANIRNKSQAIEFLINKTLCKDRTAVILAGGTDKHLLFDGKFKPLIEINGKKVIENNIEVLKKNNFSNIFIIGRKGTLSQIFNQIGDGSRYGIKLNYIEEKEEDALTPIDTARTLKVVKDKISSTFLCMHCDLIFDHDLENIFNFHVKNEGICTLVLKVTNKPTKYSTVDLEGNKIVLFKQKPKQSDSYLVYSGMFFAEPEIFNFKGTSLECEIFHEIAEQKKLIGFVTHEKIEHVHNL